MLSSVLSSNIARRLFLTFTTSQTKPLVKIHRAVDRHWVGDGFPVRTLFAYNQLGEAISPFLMLDYAEPTTFPPTDRRLGVEVHPHRGFETVTIVYSGEVEHRDSAGGGGIIGPGDVQWMTAASGLVHSEFHGPRFAKQGGDFEMAQLWVNLPAQHKLTAPRYQGILSRQIPVVDLAGDRGQVRVIAGEFNAVSGPAMTFSPVNVWDLRLAGQQHSEWPLPTDHNAILVILKGAAQVNSIETLRPAELAVFDRAGNTIEITTETDTTALLLTGKPLDEPIVGYGPFVMNSSEEIRQAILDYQSGKMGQL